MQARGLLAGSWATWGRVPGACVSVRGVAAGLRNGDSAWLGRERRRSMVYRQYPFEVSPKERTTNEGPRGTKQITSNVFVTNNVGSKFIMLNRPEVNNALNLEMLEDITDVYFKAYHEQWTRCVVLFGAGDKAFCSGGDVRSLYEAGIHPMDGPPAPQMEFFQDEYVLNQVIKTVPDVTTVALMHGYTMGGGCGLSQHADLRLVTEDVEWAMPECTLGLVPDVGSTFFLNELPDGVGRYLALTGTRLNAKEMMLCKLATHYIAWGQVPWMLERIESIEEHISERTIATTVGLYSENAFHSENPVLVAMEDRLTIHHEAIKQCFLHNTVAEIRAEVIAIKDGGGEHAEWAARTLPQLNAASPTSLAVALECLRRSESFQSLDLCLNMEFGVMRHLMAHPDFFEGVRAHIIDKDKTPNWAPEPSAAQVAAFFEELPEEQRLRLPYLEEWQPLDDDLQVKRVAAAKRKKAEDKIEALKLGSRDGRRMSKR